MRSRSSGGGGTEGRATPEPTEGTAHRTLLLYDMPLSRTAIRIRRARQVRIVTMEVMGGIVRVIVTAAPAGG